MEENKSQQPLGGEQGPQDERQKMPVQGGQSAATDTASTPAPRRRGRIVWRVLAGLVMLLTTAFAAVLLLSPSDKSAIIVVFTAIIWLPLLLASLAIWIGHLVRLCRPTVRNRLNLIVVVWGVVNALLLGGVWLQSHLYDRQVKAENLIAHYEAHEAELWELADYTRAAIDSGTTLQLEFEGGKVTMFHTQDGSHWASSGPLNADSIGATIGLTHDELEGIRRRLQRAGCIRIELGNYGSADSVTVYGRTRPVRDRDIITIARKRHMMSMYSYQLYRYPMSDSTWNHLLRNGEACIPVSDTLVLLYGSPAYGSVGYPDREGVIERLGLKER